MRPIEQDISCASADAEDTPYDELTGSSPLDGETDWDDGPAEGWEWIPVENLEDGDGDSDVGRDPADQVAHFGPALQGQSMARSRSTEQLYARMVGQRYRGSQKKRSTDSQQPVVVSPMDVVEDLIASIPTKTRSSWSLYRAALLWHLSANRHLYETYESAYQRLTSVPRLALNAAARPRTRKKKTIPHDHLVSLLTELGSMNGAVGWGPRTRFWLLAGLASGARPREWIHTRWVDDAHEVLRIRNGKLKRTSTPPFMLVPAGTGMTIFDVEADHPERLTPGAEFDESRQFRDVPIDKGDRLWVAEHLGSLQRFLNASSGTEDEVVARYDTYYQACRRALMTACRRVFKRKRSYSLYVMRSQFAANAKARLPLDEVAGLMGHSGTRTTMSHYGSRKAAHGHEGMRPGQIKAGEETHRPASETAAPRNNRPDGDRG